MGDKVRKTQEACVFLGSGYNSVVQQLSSIHKKQSVAPLLHLPRKTQHMITMHGKCMAHSGLDYTAVLKKKITPKFPSVT